ncbi:hypothetical protein EIP86_010240 [Pleurotus ostreatoroseus]|nr:hypothetical protein EIP86_010240 [Pleurotus ostreatoroseus]
MAALTRLRASAATYMKDYYEKNKTGTNLSYFADFEKQLVAIYSQRNTKETAKKEIMELWANTNLAQKDFIKYCERYCMLAHIVEYEDKLYINKITGIIPKDLRAATVGLRHAKQIPAKWEEYLKILFKIYKEYTQRNPKDNNSAKNDSANLSKGKSKEVNLQQVVTKFCQICSGNGQKGKAKIHNTVDYYDKSGNEHRHPTPKTSMLSSSSSSFSRSKGFKTFKGKKTIMARFAELQAELEHMEDDDDAAFFAATVTVNSATIEEIVDPMSSETPAIAQVNDVPKNIESSDDCKQAQVIAMMFDKNVEDLDEEDEDTKYWQSHVPDWLHSYGDVFSKRKSERMPECRERQSSETG